MIKIDNLVKTYGDLTAVDHLSLSIKPGGIYGLLGKNGAGKSTTMNILTGYIGSTSGKVTIGGYDIFRDSKKAKQQMGYLPEVPPLYDDMTVYEYLLFCSELKGIAREQRQNAVVEVIEKTKIEDVDDRLIKNLSKGYRQRVGLAQALLGYPPLIILDEPSAGLDPVQMIEMRELIKELGKDHTVILSSHILSEISEICDYVYIISEGKLVYGDSMKNLIEQEKDLEEIFVSLTCQEEHK